MRIRTPEVHRLATVLNAVPVGWRQVAPDTLVIDGATPEWFGPFAAQHQIVLYELVHERSSLEDVFLKLTQGFDAAHPPGSDSGQSAPFAHARGPVMIAVIRSEWLKLRTTAVPWVLAGIAVLINGLLILVVFLTRRRGGPAPARFGPPTRCPTPPSSCATCWDRGSRATSSPCCSAC